MLFLPSAWAHRFDPAVATLTELTPHTYAVEGDVTLPAHCTGDVVVHCAGGLHGTLTGAAEALVVHPLDGPALLSTLPASFVAPSDPSWLWIGVEHILGGADHLAFVALLVWLARGALVRTITAFTVGHSLSLALAVFGLVTVPTAAVEALIALSIVLAAAEVINADGTARPAVMAGLFGLVHGLGFASALADLGATPWALLPFNVGVELGQLAFVALVLPLRMLPGAVAAWPIGAVAAAATLQRLGEVA